MVSFRSIYENKLLFLMSHDAFFFFKHTVDLEKPQNHAKCM